MIEDLTEQWKKGELESGWYYTQVGGFKEVSPDLYDKDDNSWLCDSDKDLQPLKVLAPVPSYEELQNVNIAVNQVMKANIKLLEKNEKLKELLKECRNCVTRQIYGSSTRQYFEGIFDNSLLTKIDEALK